MRCGETFLMPAPGGPLKPHLWIVVTEPFGQSFLAVIVSVTTLRAGRDQTVILGPGDHPFIRHQSVVFFGDAQIVDTRRIDAMVRSGAALQQHPCSTALLALVQDGVLASPYSPRKVVNLCKQVLRRP